MGIVPSSLTLVMWYVWPRRGPYKLEFGSLSRDRPGSRQNRDRIGPGPGDLAAAHAPVRGAVRRHTREPRGRIRATSTAVSVPAGPGLRTRLAVAAALAAKHSSLMVGTPGGSTCARPRPTPTRSSARDGDGPPGLSGSPCSWRALFGIVGRRPGLLRPWTALAVDRRRRARAVLVAAGFRDRGLSHSPQKSPAHAGVIHQDDRHRGLEGRFDRARPLTRRSTAAHTSSMRPSLRVDDFAPRRLR